MKHLAMLFLALAAPVFAQDNQPTCPVELKDARVITFHTHLNDGSMFGANLTTAADITLKVANNSGKKIVAEQFAVQFTNTVGDKLGAPLAYDEPRKLAPKPGVQSWVSRTEPVQLLAASDNGHAPQWTVWPVKLMYEDGTKWENTGDTCKLTEAKPFRPF